MLLVAVLKIDVVLIKSCSECTLYCEFMASFTCSLTLYELYPRSFYYPQGAGSRGPPGHAQGTENPNGPTHE